MPGSWRVEHDIISPDLAATIYPVVLDLAAKGQGPAAISRQLSATYGLSMSPGTIRHWMVGDRKPGVIARVRNVFKEEPSPALSYIIGANKGDGCTMTKSGIVKLEVTDRDFAQRFNASMATLFSRSSLNKIFVRRRPDRLPMYIVKYSCRQLVRFLRQPLKNLLEFAGAFPQEFLRGFFDAEGFVEVSAQRTFDVRVGIENSNRLLLAGVNCILRRTLGISTKSRRKRKSGTLMMIRGKSFRTRRDSFRLVIDRLVDIRRFELQIGFSISRKQKKLKDALGILQTRGVRNRVIAWKRIYSKVGGEWVRA